jgi:DNA mismatch repair protein MutS
LNQDAPAFAKGNAIATGVNSLTSCSDLYRVRVLEGIEARVRANWDYHEDFFNVFLVTTEIRNTHKDKVPAEWIRKQTLVNAERYIRGVKGI